MLGINFSLKKCNFNFFNVTVMWFESYNYKAHTRNRRPCFIGHHCDARFPKETAVLLFNSMFLKSILLLPCLSCSVLAILCHFLISQYTYIILFSVYCIYFNPYFIHCPPHSMFYQSREISYAALTNCHKNLRGLQQ